MKKLTVILLIVFATASAYGQKVKVDADRSVDLSRYKTYSWATGMASPNMIIHQTIVDAVSRALSAKGLTKVDTDPELSIAIWAATESDLYVSSPSWSPALNSISTGIAAGSQSWPVTKGTLVVDIADAKTKNGVWRGTATKTLEHGPTGNPAKDAKTVEKPIQKAVEKMFKKFPRA